MSGYVPFDRLTLAQGVAANAVVRAPHHRKLPLAAFEFGVGNDGRLLGTYRQITTPEDRDRLRRALGSEISPDPHDVRSNYTPLPRGAGFHLTKE